MRRVAVRPSTSSDQNALAPFPPGATTPTPVTAALLPVTTAPPARRRTGITRRARGVRPALSDARVAAAGVPPITMPRGLRGDPRLARLERVRQLRGGISRSSAEKSCPFGGSVCAAADRGLIRRAGRAVAVRAGRTGGGGCQGRGVLGLWWKSAEVSVSVAVRAAAAVSPSRASSRVCQPAWLVRV